MACVALAMSARSRPARADDQKAAAREHFDKALAASNDQRLREAADEFEKAYALAPDFRVLYNLGKVRAALGHSVEAADAFAAYLAQGAAEIGEERAQEVRAAIDAQTAHIATLELEVPAEGAEVRVDGKLVGRSPLPSALRVTDGKHVVEALLPGRPVALRELDLLGASSTHVALEIPPSLEAPAPATRAPTLLAERPRPEPARKWRTLGVVMAGVGLAASITGCVLAYQGASDANRAKARLVEAATPAPPGAPDVTAYDAAKLAYDDARSRNQLGWGLVGVGGAAFIGGAALAIASSWPVAESRSTSAVSVAVSPVGIGIRGAW